MYSANVPLNEYRKLADHFNPKEFNADEWVRIAKDAGMKYLVYTAKHCDGFAMYKSAHPYNIVDATPFGRDPLRELAEACQRHEIKLGLYYSQAIDWEYPGAAHWQALPEEAMPGFARYLEEKAFPQIRELLTGYGPIALLWFDNPTTITAEQSIALRTLIKSLQPDCLINSRIGHNQGDYGSLGDNMIPSQGGRALMECPATLNDTWGYLPHDQNWKSADEMIRQLVSLADKGANYLLNVGPTELGTFPSESTLRLKQIGKWVKSYGEAIYGTDLNPFPYSFPWGYVTTKPERVFLHICDWPKQNLVLRGLRNKVTGAAMLADGGSSLKYRQHLVTGTDVSELDLSLPSEAPDTSIQVITLNIEGPLNIDVRLLQDHQGNLMLTAGQSERLAAPGHTPPQIDPYLGVVSGWTSPDQWLRWNFVITRPGDYEVTVCTTNNSHIASNPQWLGGHRATFQCAEQIIQNELHADRPGDAARRYHLGAVSVLGIIHFAHTGECTAELRANVINPDVPWGLSVDWLQLIPIRRSDNHQLKLFPKENIAG
jgi:alpha-L-fucosidase